MEKIIDKVKKKDNGKRYNRRRMAYLKKSICNIGKTVEEKDKIICYVDQKAIDRYKGRKVTYQLKLNGINPETDGAKNFDLNKPVYYIFDGIKFSTAVNIASLWANVTFRNCTFNKNIGIIWGDEITFESNKYIDSCPVYFYGNCFFKANMVDKLTFINDNFVNSSTLKRGTNFGMNIDARTVKFINTKIEVEAPATIKIIATKTEFENVMLRAGKVNVDSKSIEFVDSLIDSPTVVYNGINLSNKLQEAYQINEDEILLKKTRQQLVEELRNLSNYCQQLNDIKIQNFKDELNSQVIVRTLKQK